MGEIILNNFDNTFITIVCIVNMVEMSFEGYRRVHISHPGFDIEPTVSPIKEMGADRVYLLGSDKPRDVYNEIIENVRKRLSGSLAEDEIHEVRTKLFDITELLKTLRQLIESENAKNNLVFVNISSGSSLYRATALMAAQMFNGKPYITTAKKFYLDEDYYRDPETNELRGLTEECNPLTLLEPMFPITPPKEKLARALLIMTKSSEKISQTEFVKKLESYGLMEDIYEEGITQISKGTPITKRALAEFRYRFLNPLLEKEWINREGKGKATRLSITELGRMIAEIFA